MKNFSSKLLKQLLEEGLSLSEIAKESKVSKTTLSQIQGGNRKTTTFKVAEKLLCFYCSETKRNVI